MAKKKAHWTQDELIEKLSRKYRPPEWAFLVQVKNGVGWTRKDRTADALAMSLWPSRGLELHGFELKSRRSDWLIRSSSVRMRRSM